MTKQTARMESSVERALKFALIGCGGGLLAGAGFAAPIWLTGGGERGASGAVLALLIGFPLGGLLGGLLMGFLREGLGSLVDGSLQGGTRGRAPRDYSHARSLVIRGSYPEALELFGVETEANPKDPEPLLLGARVLRDNLRQPEEAAEWLRRARLIQTLTPQQDITITRELVELCEGPLDSPEKALPELARIVGTYPDSRASEWAQNALTRLRAAVWTDLKGHEGT